MIIKYLADIITTIIYDRDFIIFIIMMITMIIGLVVLVISLR
jgi:hypothetical protein